MNYFLSLTGTVANCMLIIIGSFLGTLFKKKVPERISAAIRYAIAIFVIYLGIKGFINSQSNEMVILLSIIIGTLFGTMLDLDKRLENLGNKLGNHFSKSKTEKSFYSSALTDGKKTAFCEGFALSTLLFCVGGMSILGSIESAINGNHEILYVKGILDGVSALIFASQYGASGVVASAAAVFLYQGAICIGAVGIGSFIADYAITAMICTGSILLVALSLNLLGITKLRMMNMVPSIFIAPLIAWGFNSLNWL